jgi:hypothetical protein
MSNPRAAGMAAFRLILLMSSVMIGLLSTTGCAALLLGAAAGAGGAVYMQGKLEEELLQPVPTVHQATVRALEDLQLSVVENKADQLTARLESHLADERRISIRLQALDKGKTLLSIRVGLIGDEAQSRRILEAVKNHLPS